jgi:hypothetical protein
MDKQRIPEEGLLRRVTIRHIYILRPVKCFCTMSYSEDIL